MARRGYRRDLIGHFIRREQRAQQPCTHACCRGYRVHPKNYPVILPDRTLHRASDDDLADHFRRVSREDTPKARRAEAQILHEMERRDRLEASRRERERAAGQRRQAVAARRAGERMERESETQRIRLEAEAATQGYLVSAEGRARGISDAEILTGRSDVFYRYASYEAREYFRSRPRPTAAYFRGRDTRMHERYTERPKRGGVAGRGLGWKPPSGRARPTRRSKALGWASEREAS